MNIVKVKTAKTFVFCFTYKEVFPALVDALKTTKPIGCSDVFKQYCTSLSIFFMLCPDCET